MSTNYKKIIEDILAFAGVAINGKASSDIQIHNPDFYKRVITDGQLGMGETYMAGWWDAELVDELIFKIVRAILEKKIKLNWPLKYQLADIHLFNPQSKTGLLSLDKNITI